MDFRLMQVISTKAHGGFGEYLAKQGAQNRTARLPAAA